MKIAIVGAGISGLSAAYFLHAEHDIIVYEQNAYVGGHSRTIELTKGDETTPVDTGFIVFNNWNYPHLMNLFKLLSVDYQKSDMSFGACIDNGWLEYGSSGMFAQRKNLLRPAYWGMLADILRFNRKALDYIDLDQDITLQDCLDQLNMGKWFQQYYLLAMGAAIWSCPTSTIKQFPARTFLQFFKNHGLLSINNRPQWYTVSGGSREYVKPLIEPFRNKILLNRSVVSVSSTTNKITVRDTTGHSDTFDQIIFACHADEALSMLDNPEPYQDVIGAFDYQDNRIIVHGDTSFMPRTKKCWASWVYLLENKHQEKRTVSLSYWMNNLQDLDTQYPVIVTLNPGRRPREELIYDEHTFSHPVFDLKAIRAQENISAIQGHNGMWFCGAYQRYGFHEDGLWSAVNVVKAMGGNVPWE